MTRAEMRMRLSEIRDYIAKAVAAIDAIERVIPTRGLESDSRRLRERLNGFLVTIDVVIGELAQ